MALTAAMRDVVVVSRSVPVPACRKPPSRWSATGRVNQNEPPSHAPFDSWLAAPLLKREQLSLPNEETTALGPRRQ